MEALNYLQNAANNIGASVHQKNFEDKRKKINRYFLTINGVSISPVLDYDKMNYFILGMIKMQSLINDKSN